MIRLTVYGTPRTKKTHNRVFMIKGRPRVLPSKAWVDWCAKAVIEFPDTSAWTAGLPLPDHPYNVCAHFYRDANRGDAVGYYQGLADLLEKRGIISNDKWLVGWDGSRLLKDKDNPRVEITLTPAGP